MADAFNLAEGYINSGGKTVEIFERISKGKPQSSVLWEGRRRPALTNGA